MKKIAILPLALTFALLASTSPAFAQRERASRDERRQQREQENANLTPEQQQANRASRMQELMKSMTPEQRERMQARIAEFQQKMTDAGIDPNDPNAWQKARDAGLMGQGGGGQGGGQNGRGGGRGNRAERAASEAMKQMMEAAGITDFDVQDAIVAYVAEQNKARATLFQLAQTAATALQAPVVQPINAADTGDVSTADKKVATSFTAYETAVAAENDRQEKALKELDAKIKYSTTPRVKAFLTLVGILNNDVLALGGPAAVFAAPQQGGRNAGMNGGGMNGQGQNGWNRGGRGGG